MLKQLKPMVKLMRITSTIPEVVRHVITPIAKQTTERILHELGIKDTFGSRIYYSSDNLTNTKSSKPNAINTAMVTESKALINVIPNMNPKAAAWEMGNSNVMTGGGTFNAYMADNKYIFQDHLNGITIQEHLVPCSMELECKLAIDDRVTAYEIHDRILSLYDNGEMITLENFIYSYPLPDSTLYPLYGLYKMSVDDPTEYLDYLDTHSAGRIGTAVNRYAVDHAKQVMVRKNHYKTICKIEYDADKPEAVTEGKTAKYHEIRVKVTVQFARTNFLHVEYPVSIKNKLVSKDLLVVDEELEEPLHNHPYFSFDVALASSDSIGNNGNAPMVHKPFYDQFLIPSTSLIRQARYVPIVSQHVLLDNIADPDGVTTVDLRDIGLIDPVYQVMTNSEHSALELDAPYHVSVFSRRVQIGNGDLSIDGTQLTIKSRNIFKDYHIVISHHPKLSYEWSGVHDNKQYIVKHDQGKYYERVVFEYETTPNGDAMYDNDGNLIVAPMENTEGAVTNLFEGTNYGTYRQFRIVEADIRSKH